MAFKKPKNRALDFAVALACIGIVFGAFSPKSEEEKEADEARRREVHS